VGAGGGGSGTARPPLACSRPPRAPPLPGAPPRSKRPLFDVQNPDHPSVKGGLKADSRANFAELGGVDALEGKRDGNLEWAPATNLGGGGEGARLLDVYHAEALLVATSRGSSTFDGLDIMRRLEAAAAAAGQDEAALCAALGVGPGGDGLVLGLALTGEWEQAAPGGGEAEGGGGRHRRAAAPAKEEGGGRRGRAAAPPRVKREEAAAAGGEEEGGGRRRRAAPAPRVKAEPGTEAEPGATSTRPKRARGVKKEEDA